MATNFFELATTLKNLGAKWLPEKKINFTPWVSIVPQIVKFSLQSEFFFPFFS